MLVGPSPKRRRLVLFPPGLNPMKLRLSPRQMTLGDYKKKDRDE